MASRCAQHCCSACCGSTRHAHLWLRCCLCHCCWPQVTNNVIRNVWGAGLGVAGGYNVLVAHNSMFRCECWRCCAVRGLVGDKLALIPPHPHRLLWLLLLLTDTGSAIARTPPSSCLGRAHAMATVICLAAARPIRPRAAGAPSTASQTPRPFQTRTCSSSTTLPSTPPPAPLSGLISL